MIADVLAHHGTKDVVSQGALVAMATDGAVKAMVGGRDYNESQFNRATQAQRQPGSAFKPFVYLAGLEAGLRPEDRFVDGPIQIGNWRPRNYTNKYLGEMSVAEGLAQSINTIAVQVAQRAGIPNVIAVANRLGIASDLARDASIALGTNEVNLWSWCRPTRRSPMAATACLPTASPRSATAQARSSIAAPATGPGRSCHPTRSG